MRDLLKIGLLAALAAASACKPRSDSALRDTETTGPAGPSGHACDLQGEDLEWRGKTACAIYDYDGGPDRDSPMGKELIDLHAKIPYFPGLSNAIYGEQFFRPTYGPMPWRMMQKPNSIKILFIGQDGTHIAEAANRPATAGFGGRAQDLAAYMGVTSSAAFINTYAFTIKWQYGVFDAPVVRMDPATGKPKSIRFEGFTPNQVWLMTQDQDSPIVKWRNNLIEWIIKNNRESLKMVVLFGGAARDAAGAFVVSRGGEVAPRTKEADLPNLKVAEFKLEGAGSNKQTAVPIDGSGGDIFKKTLNQTFDYTNAGGDAARKKYEPKFNANPEQLAAQLVLPKGGIGGSGVLHPAQLGGYDVNRGMRINGQNTISLKGLRLSDGSEIQNDVLVVQLPHPTMLSMQTPDKAAELVSNGLFGVKKFMQTNEWRIDKDADAEDRFFAGQGYDYKRGDMGTEYYDFGAPASRMVNKSDAVRAGADTIVFGSRDKSGFTNSTMKAKLKAMGEASASNPPPNDEMWIARAASTTGDRRMTWDPGPPREWAKVMKRNLPRDEAFLDIPEIAVNGDAGLHRGTFENPQVVIVADPDGYDDLMSSRALTGTRGQYLNGLMQDLGVGDKYLVLKTVPYNVQGVQAVWDKAVSQTNKYREAVLAKVADLQPKLVIVDGDFAKSEFDRIVTNMGDRVVYLKRSGGETANEPGDEPAKTIADIKELADAINAKSGVTGFQTVSGDPHMLDIPRSHLAYYARVWEGTSGDRVVTSNTPQWKGKAFAMVAPSWAYKQKFDMKNDRDGCSKLFNKLIDAKVRLTFRESMAQMKNRLDAGGQAPNPCMANNTSASNGESSPGAPPKDDTNQDPVDFTYDPHEEKFIQELLEQGAQQ